MVRRSTVSFHRIFSPPSPPSSRPARSFLTVASATLAASSSFCATALLNLSSSIAILSSTSLSCARSLFRLMLSSSSCSIASASALRLGSTSFATKWYLFMACTHWHMAVHALDADSIFLGVNSSLVTYGCSASMIFSGMLSLSKLNIESSSSLPLASIALPGIQ